MADAWQREKQNITRAANILKDIVAYGELTENEEVCLQNAVMVLEKFRKTFD